jgi:hypothetical protein
MFRSPQTASGFFANFLFAKILSAINRARIIC